MSNDDGRLGFSARKKTRNRLFSKRVAELGLSVEYYLLDAGGAGDAGHACRFLAGAAVLLGGFLIVAVPLDITDQALFFAHLLKPLNHLLDTFAGS